MRVVASYSPTPLVTGLVQLQIIAKIILKYKQITYSLTESKLYMSLNVPFFEQIYYYTFKMEFNF